MMPDHDYMRTENEPSTVGAMRVPHVQEQMSRLFSITDKLDACAADLSIRLESVLNAEKPAVAFGDGDLARPPGLPPLAMSISDVAERLERLLVRLEDLQSRIES